MSEQTNPSAKEVCSPRGSTSISHDVAPSASSPSPTPTMEPAIDPAYEAFNIRSPAFWLVIVSVYLAFFLIALDRMIIATAIPAITNSFGSISDIGWYASAYMMTCAIFNPLFGSIYRFYSVKWVFMASVVLFEIGSAICGASPTSASFIAGRAIAGVGAAGKYSLIIWRSSMNLGLRLTVPRYKRWRHHDHGRACPALQTPYIYIVPGHGLWFVVCTWTNHGWCFYRQPVSHCRPFPSRTC